MRRLNCLDIVSNPRASSSPEPLYAIGEISALTGVSTHTIRVWERRYGAPKAVRLPSGHRRYTEEHVVWLRMMAELLTYGHRPGKLMAMPHDELSVLLHQDRGNAFPNYDELGGLILQVAKDGASVVSHPLRKSLHEFGVRRAMSEFIAPLIQMVGRSWAEGELAIRHEHLISETIQDILRETRQSIQAKLGGSNGGPAQLLLATLPGERHGMGLEMIHLLAIDAGCRVQLLGVDMPVTELAASLQEHPDATLALSVSMNSNGPDVEHGLVELVDLTGGQREILVGGAGARSGRRQVPGVTYCAGLSEFGAWVDSKMDETGGRPKK